MQLRFLLVTGPHSPPAAVEFGPGLNVIYGGSNTGKSHILRLVDYLLGAREPPDPIVEQSGYDLAHLGLVLDGGRQVTLVRALQGGDVRVLDGLVRDRPLASQGSSVSANHGAKVSLSKHLLATLGAANARVRVDAAGKTRDLSFRDLEKLALVDETKIQSPVSPVLTGQFATKTAETSVFKYLLTGVDDSALDLAKPDPTQPMRRAAQLELLDKQILEFEKELSELTEDDDLEDLSRQDSELENQLTSAFQIQETVESTYRELAAKRRELRQEFNGIQDRIAEIDTLHARFDLLSKHYDSDKGRLNAIVEAGEFFLLEEGTTCPVCGAAPSDQNHAAACDGDISAVLAAATAEVAELGDRARELKVTIAGLAAEREALASRSRDVLPQLDSLQEGILREVPSVQSIRLQTTNVIQRRVGVQRKLDLFRRRDSYVAKRAELGVSPGYDSSTIVAQDQLDGAVLDAFCQAVEAELQSWEFPDAQRVFFELRKMDISVAGKSRSANGKGVRALLHGAFSVALMKFCGERKTTHPGFVILDSLFITYRDPADAEEAVIATTPLKDRAFKAFASLPDSLQLIVLENVDVPEWLRLTPQCLHFSGQPTVGRVGLFPGIGVVGKA